MFRQRNGATGLEQGDGARWDHDFTADIFFSYERCLGRSWALSHGEESLSLLHVHLVPRGLNFLGMSEIPRRGRIISSFKYPGLPMVLTADVSYYTDYT